MKKTKRFFSGLLVALSIFSMCVFPASAHSENTNDSHTHKAEVADSITPRSPTCMECGGDVYARYDSLVVEMEKPCPKVPCHTHAIRVDGDFYWCSQCGAYNGIARVVRKYIHCGNGCPDEYL